MKTRLDFRTQPFLNQKTGKHHEKLRSVRLANVQNYDIDAVIKFALDNNYIEGAKYELAKGIVQGVIEAERELVKMGHSLTINKWMSVRPSVEGSVDAVKRQLTAGKNRIRIKVRPLKEMKLALDDFSFRCIDDDLKSKDAPTPVIEYLYSSGHEDEYDAMYEAAAFAIKGTNLATAAECELTFKDRNGKEHTTAFVGADGDWALKARHGMYGFRPMWQVPQAFDWAHYVKKTYAGQDKNWKKPKDMRMPTFEDMRSMSWQAIAAGANGLVYYYFEDAYRRGATKEESAKRWADVCAVAREVKEKEAIILSEPGSDVSSDSKSLVCRTWIGKNGAVHLLACNTSRKAVDAKVRAGGRIVCLSIPPTGIKWTELRD